MKNWLIVLVVLYGISGLKAQPIGSDSTIISQDSMSYVDSFLAELQPMRYTLKPAYIVYFESKEDARAFKKARYNVKKVYDYYVQAMEVMENTDKELENIDKKRKQNKYIRTKKKYLKGEFKDVLKDLSVEQGRTLVKMIERRTEEPLYNIIKTYESGLVAEAWNKIAQINGYSLKEGYDPEADRFIEMVMQAIEDGYEL